MDKNCSTWRCLWNNPDYDLQTESAVLLPALVSAFMIKAQLNNAPTTQQHPLLRLIGLLSDICGAVAAGMIMLAVLITCQMIWVRYVNNASTVWQTEAVIYLMIGATLVGLPYVQRVRGHVNVDLLPRLLPRALSKVLAILTLIMAIAVIGIMLFYGAELWLVAMQRGWRSDTVWGVPLWIPYLSMPVGFGLFVLQLIADLIAVVTDADEPFDLTSPR